MKIAIVAAIPEEIDLLRNQVKNAKHENIFYQKFTTGQLCGFDVVLLECNMGKVNAAIGTTLLNQLYNPDVVINITSAGGIKEGIELNDMVIADQLCYYDVDLTPFGYEYGQIDPMPPLFATDAKINEIIKSVAINDCGHNVFTGLIATGDSFIGPKNGVILAEKLPDALAVEMEAAAIAQVCYMYHKPLAVVAFISDLVTVDNNAIAHVDDLWEIDTLLRDLIIKVLQNWHEK
ncbi:MAG: 5'-methylthioadenosine/adenosylhomocysteine nucleosidase [Gammaproteobacteria bacterium]|nr:5'-methylthioadenosine/adenosylhomocysteine nucleosidase [Gammaproteobacteria bacterium]